MEWRSHFSYSVSSHEVSAFVDSNACVREFLNRYAGNGSSYTEKAVGLARFFRWLRVAKCLEITPSQFLDAHLAKHSSPSVEDRRWALKLALEYSRDNPDLKEKASNYVYAAFFLPVKLFCDYHEAPLTMAKGFFPKRGRRKYVDRPFTANFIKQCLATLSQRDRAICMTQLQSGQSIRQILVDVSLQCEHIFSEMDAGKQRIRLNFLERKGNGFAYFTFISTDAIQEIQKWRPIRSRILKDVGKKSAHLFITDTGRPLPCKQFHNNLRRMFIRHKLYSGPLSVRSHGFRKFFEQEASPPERGVSRAYVTFMMGHSSGKDTNGNRVAHPLDVPGGVYDHAPQVYPSAVEKEYAKLEPYLNIYSQRSPEFGMDPDTFEALVRRVQDHVDKLLEIHGDEFERRALEPTKRPES